MRNKILILIATLALLAPISIFAMTIGPSTGGSIIFDISPQNPGTNTEVVVKADTYSDDIDRCKVSWYLNGKLEVEGIGRKNFSFKTGAAGKLMTVKMIIQTLEGAQIERSFSVNPGDIDLIWQADTYVPPFYKGKALATTGSKVKVIAIPNFVSANGVKIQAGDIIYKWKNKNGNLSSGHGMNSITTEMPIPVIDNEITVEASDLQGNITATKTLKLKSANPRILVYEDLPLTGTEWSRASWSAVNLVGEESTLRVEPYFFSNPTSSADKNLNITWTLNGKTFSPNENSDRVAIFRNELGQEVTSNLEISVTNLKKAYQSAKGIFTIKSQPKLFKF